MTHRAILLPLLFQARNRAELARLVAANHDRESIVHSIRSS